MKRYTLVTDRMMDNFDVLGNHVVMPNGDEVMIHRHPTVNMRGDKITTNFDLLITNGDRVSGLDMEALLPAGQIAVLKRWDKFTQMARLAMFRDRLIKDGVQLDNFLAVPTWYIGLDTARNFPTAGGYMVVKPLDGARGIGQFVVDTDKVNLNHFAAMLRNNILGNSEMYDKLDTWLLEKFDGAVSYHSVTENTKHEGLDSIQSQGVIIQSMIEDIGAEYRIITGPQGEPVYCQLRGIRDKSSKYPQACGAGDIIDTNNVVSINSIFPKEEDLNGFLELVRHAIGPMNSLDLFITKEGKWGIFEFCNQFGVSGIPHELVVKIHVDFIASMIKNYEMEQLGTRVATRAEVSA